MEPSPAPSPDLPGELLTFTDTLEGILIFGAILIVVFGPTFFLFRLVRTNPTQVVGVGLVFLTFSVLLTYLVVREKDLITLAATGIGALATATTAQFAVEQRRRNQPYDDADDESAAENDEV